MKQFSRSLTPFLVACGDDSSLSFKSMIIHNQDARARLVISFYDLLKIELPGTVL